MQPISSRIFLYCLGYSVVEHFSFVLIYYVTVLYTQNDRRLPGLFVLNKRHQAVESPAQVHRSSVN